MHQFYSLTLLSQDTRLIPAEAISQFYSRVAAPLLVLEDTGMAVASTHPQPFLKAVIHLISSESLTESWESVLDSQN